MVLGFDRLRDLLTDAGRLLVGDVGMYSSPDVRSSADRWEAGRFDTGCGGVLSGKAPTIGKVLAYAFVSGPSLPPENSCVCAAAASAVRPREKNMAVHLSRQALTGRGVYL